MWGVERRVDMERVDVGRWGRGTWDGTWGVERRVDVDAGRGASGHGEWREDEHGGEDGDEEA